MTEQLHDFFGEIFQRYFGPAIGAYPRMGAALVERLLTLTDDVPDRLAQTRRAAMAWGKPRPRTPTRSIGLVTVYLICGVGRHHVKAVRFLLG